MPQLTSISLQSWKQLAPSKVLFFIRFARHIWVAVYPKNTKIHCSPFNWAALNGPEGLFAQFEGWSHNTVLNGKIGCVNGPKHKAMPIFGSKNPWPINPGCSVQYQFNLAIPWSFFVICRMVYCLICRVVFCPVLPAYSDTIGTREKCHCKQVSL